jgi:hypothetical protein
LKAPKYPQLFTFFSLRRPLWEKLNSERKTLQKLPLCSLTQQFVTEDGEIERSMYKWFKPRDSKNLITRSHRRNVNICLPKNHNFFWTFLLCHPTQPHGVVAMTSDSRLVSSSIPLPLPLSLSVSVRPTHGRVITCCTHGPSA